MYHIPFLLFTLILCVNSLPVQERSSGRSLWGVTYTARNSDGSCQTSSQVATTFQKFRRNGILNIRTYSQECDQLTLILQAIDSMGGGMTVMAGVWIDGTDSDNTEIRTIASVVRRVKNTDAIIGITVGSEVIQRGVMSPGELAGKINRVKSACKGFKVGTADTTTGYASELISVSDIIIVNIHPFFGGVPATEAASNLRLQYNNFLSKVQNKAVYIGETGWPSAGESNGRSVPGASHLETFVNGMMNVDLKYYFFESVDAAWKSGGDYGVEPHWGLWTANGRSKIPSIQD
ncbi:glycoside hydrolase superfamily [Phycomyces nitens]|nr:glycoside hydrolase superfamily [Phycomyces nitens]